MNIVKIYIPKNLGVAIDGDFFPLAALKAKKCAQVHEYPSANFFTFALPTKKILGE